MSNSVEGVDTRATYGAERANRMCLKYAAHHPRVVETCRHSSPVGTCGPARHPPTLLRISLVPHPNASPTRLSCRAIRAGPQRTCCGRFQLPHCVDRSGRRSISRPRHSPLPPAVRPSHGSSDARRTTSDCPSFSRYSTRTRSLCLQEWSTRIRSRFAGSAALQHLCESDWHSVCTQSQCCASLVRMLDV